MTATALVGSAGLAACHGTQETGFAEEIPLQFDSEVVRLHIDGDTLTVEGVYRFLCGPSPSEFMSLFYPYPDDSLLGYAGTVSVDCRGPGESWRPLDFAELPQNRGARWMIPLTLTDTLEVRAVYRQVLLDSYARYVLTTTAAWLHPLRTARFEVYLPNGAKPEHFSLPFKPTTSNGRQYYLYEALDFRPDCDITVRWTAGGR